MSTPEKLPARKLSTKATITWIVVIFIVVYSYSSRSGTSTPSSSSSSTIAASTAWIPSGFDSYDADIAYKWVDKPTCDTYSICAAIQVVANKNCPNDLYAELTLQDKNYVQYAYTNDAQGSLSMGSTAELTFNFAPDDRFAHFMISQISCY